MRVDVNRVAAELLDACFKRQARARRAFFEHHHQRPVGQRVIGFVIFEFAFDDMRTRDQVFVLVERKVTELQKMFDCHR